MSESISSTQKTQAVRVVLQRMCKVEIRKLQRERVIQQHEAVDLEASHQRLYIDAVLASRTGAPAFPPYKWHEL